MVLDDKLMVERMKIEDEERRLKSELERAKRDKMKQLQESMKTQQEVNVKFVQAAAERETKLAEIERERRLRHLAEDEARRKADEVMELEKAAELEKMSEIADMDQMIADARSWRQQQERERQGMVEEERRRYILEVSGGGVEGVEGGGEGEGGEGEGWGCRERAQRSERSCVQFLVGARHKILGKSTPQTITNPFFCSARLGSTRRRVRCGPSGSRSLGGLLGGGSTRRL